MNEIQAKLDHVHAQFKDTGLHQALQKFDRLVRPETSSFLEPKIVGREKELKQLMGMLGVCGARNRGRTDTKERMTELHVLPIVGMGGVGKTTMAQQICSDAEVKTYFKDHIIWTCVSDDFDTKRLAKEIIERLGGKTSPSDNLDSIMRKLEACVMSKRFLLVLDDMWDDVLKQDGSGWRMFCEPLKIGAQGSRVLVTTRSPEVANLVGPMNHYELKGLQDAIFWDFFKSCAFGSMSSFNNRESMECIGKNIITKLKGSPLAAKTIGRLLSMDLSTSHWDNIVQSELWQLEQTATDILPALRLSYLYLPQKLKRCFSICALYPKDHGFKKTFLYDTWVAQGYVGDHQEASLCFEALENRSFFQNASPGSNKYVIHDLMHDTARLVSKDECFTIKNVSDIDKVPSNVRHLSLFTDGYVKCSELKRICNRKKLRSLVCDKSSSSSRDGWNSSPIDFAPLIDSCFKELLKIRVLRIKVCSVHMLPESMGNLKHLRYLCLLGDSNRVTLPWSVCRMHHLKIIESEICSREGFPRGFGDAISLQEIRSGSFTYSRDRSDKLCLNWRGTGMQKVVEDQMEAIPHCNLQHLKLDGYNGESSPSWFRPNILTRLRVLDIWRCNTFKSMPFFGPLEGSLDNVAGSQGFVSLTRISISTCGSLTYIPLHGWSLPSLEELDIYQCHSLASIGVCGEGAGVKGFSSLAKIYISACDKLLSLDGFLMSDYLPVVRTVSVTLCKELTSLSVDRLDGLQDLKISMCPKLISQRVMTFPSTLKRLHLSDCDGIESININNSQLSNSSELERLCITSCPGLKSIGGATAIDKIKYVSLWGSSELKDIQQPLRRSDSTPRADKHFVHGNSGISMLMVPNTNSWKRPIAEPSVRRGKLRKRSADASTSGT